MDLAPSNSMIQIHVGKRPFQSVYPPSVFISSNGQWNTGGPLNTDATAISTLVVNHTVVLSKLLSKCPLMKWTIVKIG